MPTRMPTKLPDVGYKVTVEGVYVETDPVEMNLVRMEICNEN